MAEETDREANVSGSHAGWLAPRWARLSSGLGREIWRGWTGILTAMLVVLAIITIVVMVVLSTRHGEQKALGWGVVSQGPLVSVQEGAGGRLRVLFDGKPRADLFRVLVKLQNVGGDTLDVQDFRSPILIYFGTKVLGAEVVDPPPSLNVDLQLVDATNSVRIAPLLLNVGSGLTIRAIVAGRADKIKVSAQIAGAKVLPTDFAEKKPGGIVGFLNTNAGIALLVVALVFPPFFWLMWQGNRAGSPISQTAGAISREVAPAIREGIREGMREALEEWKNEEKRRGV